MTIEECYKRIGGDYKQISNALGSENIVKKFLLKLIDEETHLALDKALENNDYKEAFRAAHTIKGICLNLSLTRLFIYVNPLTEALRNQDSLNYNLISKLHKEFNKEYKMIIDTIREFRDNQ